MRKIKERSLPVVFLVGYLAYSSIYVARLNFSVASTLFQECHILDKAQIGIIGSIFSFTYAISKIPNGYMGDRLSTKKLLVWGLLIVSLSNLLIGLFPCFFSIAILWGLNAYGQSILWGPLLRTFSQHYGETRFRRISQYLASSVAVGSIIGLMLAAECAAVGSAALCFLIPSAVTLVMALAVKLIFSDVQGNGDGDGKSESMKQALRDIFSEASFRRVMFPAMAHGMIKDNINVWMAVYFIETFQVDLKAMGWYIFFIPVMGLVGRLLYPAVYRVLKNEYYVSSCSFLLCAVAAAAICIDSVTAPMAMLCLGMMSALASMINTHMVTAFPAAFPMSGHLSFVASMMDLLTYGGAGVGSLVFGFLIQHSGYKGMFLVWCAISGMSVLVLLAPARVVGGKKSLEREKPESRFLYKKIKQSKMQKEERV